MAKKEPEKSNIDLKDFDITDLLYKLLAKLLQEKEVRVDDRIYKQFESLLIERKVTYEYEDGVFKLKKID